ncbi:hypothetical protein V2I01_01760 [Micromonospora sp. BRA006-A]|nr:hypothetical protein [Micromonospora sp. BRA006-A]
MREPVTRPRPVREQLPAGGPELLTLLAGCCGVHAAATAGSRCSGWSGPPGTARSRPCYGASRRAGPGGGYRTPCWT